MSDENVVDTSSSVPVANVVTAEIVEKQRGRPRKYSFPSKLVCTVTGKTVLTNPVQFAKQLTDSGKTMEEYIASYVCRSARANINKTTVVNADGIIVTKKKGRPIGSKNTKPSEPRDPSKPRAPRKPREPKMITSVVEEDVVSSEPVDIEALPPIDNIRKVWGEITERTPEECMEDAEEFMAAK